MFHVEHGWTLQSGMVGRMFHVEHLPLFMERLGVSLFHVEHRLSEASLFSENSQVLSRSRSTDGLGFLGPHQKEAPQGMRNRNRLAPIPSGDLLDFGQVASAGPKNNLFCCYLLRPRPFEEGGEFAERARAHIVKGGDLLPKLFVAPRQHLCVLKSQFSNDFREKCDFLDAGFNQKNLQIWPDNLQGEPWKAASRPYVGEPTVFHRYGHRRIHTLAKMTIKNLQGVTNRGQIDLFVPSQQNLYISLNLQHLVVIRGQIEFC